MHAEKSYEVFDHLTIDVTPFDNCGPVEMRHLAGPYKAHFVIVFGFESVDDSRVAYSSPCIVKRSDSRPAVGYVIFNLK